MQNSRASDDFERFYRPTDAELENLRAYRESAEPPEVGAELEATEDEFEALTPSELAAITDLQIIEKFASSDKAVNFVINYEVGSQALYDRRYRSPIWPKGMSGITIGIGFDIGYHSESEFTKAWQANLPPEHFTRLNAAIGFKTTRGGNRAGQVARARRFVRDFSDIEINFDIAKKVFLETTTPLHGRRALKVFANMMELHPHAFGALYSLVYNRGPAMGRSSRRREMRNIRDYMAARQWDPIPDEFRAMKRIWRGRGLAGLLRRRDGEAQLFLEGLQAMRMVATAPPPASCDTTAPSPAGSTHEHLTGVAYAEADDPNISAHDMGLSQTEPPRQESIVGGAVAAGTAGAMVQTAAILVPTNLESLYLELGKRSEIARSDQEAFAQDQLPELEGFWDEAQLIERGQRLFFRIEKSLHALMCGDSKSDLEDRAKLHSTIGDAADRGADMAIGALSQLVSSYLLIPRPIADIAAELVVQRVLAPALEEMKDATGNVVTCTCMYWAGKLRNSTDNIV